MKKSGRVTAASVACINRLETLARSLSQLPDALIRAHGSAA
jgi:hypothetical protein